MVGTSVIGCRASKEVEVINYSAQSLSLLTSISPDIGYSSFALSLLLFFFFFLSFSSFCSFCSFSLFSLFSFFSFFSFTYYYCTEYLARNPHFTWRHTPKERFVSNTCHQFLALIRAFYNLPKKEVPENPTKFPLCWPRCLLKEKLRNTNSSIQSIMIFL